MKKFPFLLLVLCASCGIAGGPQQHVPKAEVRFAAVVEGRTIHLFVREDTIFGGKPVYRITLDDPLNDQQLTTVAHMTNPDSLWARLGTKPDGSGGTELRGTRGDGATWNLTYTRPGAVGPVALGFREDPSALIFERKDYHGQAQVSEPTGESNIAPGVVNGLASKAVYTYRITDRATGEPHPADKFLRKFICGDKTYEQFATVGKEDYGGTTYSVGLEYRNDDRIVFRVERSYYEEFMAHDQMGSRLLNYDLIDQKEVKLADVVPPKNHGKLKALAKRAFYAKYTDRNMRNNTFRFTDNVAFLRN
ncbi:MAG: hypothetical protein KF797_15170, partial [Flavobacteriales bacterium]|nr:hypothetical protein [Flavobacteriales bacterium]